MNRNPEITIDDVRARLASIRSDLQSLVLEGGDTAVAHEELAENQRLVSRLERQTESFESAQRARGEQLRSSLVDRPSARTEREIADRVNTFQAVET